MSSSTNPKSASDQGDPWEQLAEDLFGLEYGKEHGSRESSPPATEPVPTPPAAAPQQHVVFKSRQEPAAATSPVEAEPADFHDEPSRATSPPAGEPSFVEPPVFEPSFVESPFVESGTSQETVEASPPAAGSGSPQDSYWDALANWNWDESEGPASKARSEAPSSAGGPPPRGGPRGRDDRRDRRGGDRPQRQASESAPAGSSRPVSTAPGSNSPGAAGSSAPAPRHSSAPPRSSHPAAGDDFGLGVDDLTAHDESDKPAPVADRDEHKQSPGQRGSEPGHPKQEEGDFPKKRRRRRRRRSRGSDREGGTAPGSHPGATSTSASAIPGDEWEDDDSAGPEAADSESDAGVVEVPAPAADSPAETTDQAERGRHGRSRGRRNGPRHERSRRSESTRYEGRGDEGPREHPSEHEEEPLLVGGGVEPAADDDDEDDAVDQAVSYEDVPTWEEAISYLLHPSQVQVEQGAGNGSPPPRQSSQADQPRQTRHMGGQKHRR